MRPSRWAITVLVTGTALAASTIWIAGTTASAQPPTVQPAATMTLAQRITQRRPLLDRRESRRLEILNRLEFGGRLPIPIPEFPNICLLPRRTAAASIDPHRSLFVHDRATLGAGNFSLERTLGQIAVQASALVPGLTAERVFGQLWDTQNPPPGVFPPGPHCTSPLNGFPINCPRVEGQEAANPPASRIARMGDYRPIGLVNRLDLAHQGWRNCGEHRIVYGKQNGFQKNFIIFEAVLPNPRPGCREGCVPVAEFWKSLSAIDNPAARAAQLETFFYTGLPGFRPVVHVDHYSSAGVSTGYGSSGSGQIRTNQFLQNPWVLKEFKTVIDCGGPSCVFSMVPTMVKVNPHGSLWNEDNAAGDPRAADFQADTVAQLTRLQSATMSGIGYDVDLVNDAGQSMSSFGPGFVDDYRAQMNNALLPNFRAALATGPLTADQISRRALTQSCAGCHMPGSFGLDAPNSIGTVTTPVGSVHSRSTRGPRSSAAALHTPTRKSALVRSWWPTRRRSVVAWATNCRRRCSTSSCLIARTSCSSNSIFRGAGASTGSGSSRPRCKHARCKRRRRCKSCLRRDWKRWNKRSPRPGSRRAPRGL